MRLSANPFDLVGADIEVSGGNLALIVSDHEIGEWPLDSVSIDAEIDGFHMRVDGEEFVFSTKDADAFAAAVGVSRFGARAKKPGRSAKAVKAIKSSKLVQTQSSESARDGSDAGGRSAGGAVDTKEAPPRRRAASPPVAVPRKSRTPSAVPRKQSKPSLGGRLQGLKSTLAEKQTSISRRLMFFAVAVVFVALAIVARPLLAGLLLFAGMAGVLLAGATAVDPILATRLPEDWPATRLAIWAGTAIATGLVLVAF